MCAVASARAWYNDEKQALRALARVLFTSAAASAVSEMASAHIIIIQISNMQLFINPLIDLICAVLNCWWCVLDQLSCPAAAIIESKLQQKTMCVMSCKFGWF